MVKTKQGIQYYNWFFTFNNYEQNEITGLKIQFNKLCKKYVFQEETGEEGTKHLQGSISLKKKARLTELKKIEERIHWETTKNCKAADKYCCKEETRTGEIFTHEKKKAFIRTKSKFDDIEPRQDIIECISKEPDNRTINWFWSDKGAVGKTSTAAWIEHNYENVCVVNGKGADMKNQVIKHLENNELDILIITVPRSAKGYVSYGTMEEIKDGLIYSGKYEGGFANIEYPHVIVLANFAPDNNLEEVMSKDKFNIVNIDIEQKKKHPMYNYI
ncbi:MAG: putative viral replication protein [Circoviridae sp.]|nr:MAG: putative viral replication protein [Circoviridae sp.]